MRFFRKRSDSFKDETRLLLELLQCECVVFSENMAMDEVREQYKRANLLGKSEGFVPVFLIPSQPFINLMVNVPNYSIGVSKFQARDKAIEKMCQYIMETKKMENIEIQENITYHQFLMEHEQYGKLNKEVIMAKIPVKKPWEIFLYFPIGVKDAGQEKINFISIAKYLYETKGAVPVSVSYDAVEFLIDFALF